MPRIPSHHGDRFMKVDSFGELEHADCALCGESASSVVVVQHMFGEDFHVVKCSRCGLIRTNPRPTPDWKASLYDPSKNSVMEKFGRDFIFAAEENRLPSYRRLLRFALTYLEPGDKLIDIGAAAGNFVKMAADEGIDATACDYSKEALEHCERTFGIPTLQSAANAIDAPDESFDFVSMLHTVEHLPEPLEAMREMRRVLKPGGTLFLETPNYAMHHLIQTRMRWLIPPYRKLTKRDGIPWVPFDHYYHWTPALMRRALTEAGFSNVRSHHFLGYRSQTNPNPVFSLIHSCYDLFAVILHTASFGKIDVRLVLLATATK